MKCDCEDWKKNIPILDGMISMQANMAWGNSKGYTGKVFVFCPWCGKELKPDKIRA